METPPPATTPPPGGGSPKPAGTAGGAPRTTNGFAVTSFVTGLLTPCGVLPGFAGLVFGFIGLRQIKRRGQRGAGLAIAGIAAAGFWLVVAVAAAAVALAMTLLSPTLTGDPADPADPADPGGAAQAPGAPSAPPTADPDAEVAGVDEAERVSVFDLKVGYCLDELWGDEDSGAVLVVPCAEPHDGQIFSRFDLPDGSWPGLDKVEADSYDGCWDRLADDFPRAHRDEWVDVWTVYPLRFTWRAGDREVLCITLYLDDQRTGSWFEEDNYPESVSGAGPDI